MRVRLLLAGLEALTWLAGVIPRYPVADGLCRLGGILWYLAAPAARAAVADNLRHIYGHSPSRLQVLRVFQNGALNYWDTFAITSLSPQALLAQVDVHGRENFEAALVGGKGAIVASAHLGSVAFVAQAVPALGFPTTGLTEAIEPPELYAFFARQRMGHSFRIFPVGTAGLREVVHTLRRNEVVGLITDREFGGPSVLVPFFGQPTSFPEGVAALSLRTGAPIIIGVCARKARGRFDAWFEPLETVLTTDDQKQNVRAVTQAIARRLQYYVANHPAQWTVFQKRWPGDQ